MAAAHAFEAVLTRTSPIEGVSAASGLEIVGDVCYVPGDDSVWL
jgi:hypothetical protein